MTRDELHNQRLLKEASYETLRYETRRHFLKQSITGLGAMAFGSLMGGCNIFGADKNQEAALNIFDSSNPLAPRPPMFPGKAKSVIYLHMAGAPSQLELFDYKPELAKLDGQECPQSLLEGKRFAFIRGVPKMLGAQAKFE